MEYSKRKQLSAMDRALMDYYLKNPKRQQEDHLKTVLEILSPIAAGSLIGRTTRIPKNVATFAGAAAGVAAPVLGTSARRRKALYDMGIDTNLRGSYAKPINDKGEEYFK